MNYFSDDSGNSIYLCGKFFGYMEKTVSFRDKQVAYHVQGEGACVVLIHGFLEDHSIWHRFSEVLAKHYQVICVDMPGFGKSACVAETHTMELMADVVKEVLDAEAVKSCVYVGHSMGGYVGAAFAEKYPEMLSGLVFFHSHAAADSEEVKINRLKTIELVKRDALRFIVSFIPLLFAEENMERCQPEITRLQESASHIGAEAVIAALSGMRERTDQRELLKTLDFPVMFVVGKQDSRISMENILPQIQLPKHAEALILDGVGHMGFIEAEQLTMQTLEGFVKRSLNLLKDGKIKT